MYPVKSILHIACILEFNASALQFYLKDLCNLRSKILIDGMPFCVLKKKSSKPSYFVDIFD